MVDESVHPYSYDYGMRLRIQCMEIREHRWCLSETAGKDVGDNEASYDWQKSGHGDRFREAYNRHYRRIESVVRHHDVRSIPVTLDLIHRLMNDYNAGRKPKRAA